MLKVEDFGNEPVDTIHIALSELDLIFKDYLYKNMTVTIVRSLLLRKLKALEMDEEDEQEVHTERIESQLNPGVYEVMIFGTVLKSDHCLEYFMKKFPNLDTLEIRLYNFEGMTQQISPK